MKKNNLTSLLILFSIIFFSCTKVDTTNETSQLNNIQIIKDSSGFRDSGGSSGGVTFECTSCLITYPDNSNMPRSGQAFNESDVLVASDPGQNTCGTQPDFIKVWYSDEHPICLGVRQVVIKTNGLTTTTNYPITPGPTKSPSYALDPLIGSTEIDSDHSGNDLAVDGGRPLTPSLYITDITDNLKSRSGDWQQGGKAYSPDRIYGMWKAAVKIVDKTKTPALVTMQMDADPLKSNGWDLAGGVAPPFGTPNEKYGAMVAWDVNKLKVAGVFISGRIYRIQFMVHDGDQNKTGGDVGQSCSTIIID